MGLFTRRRLIKEALDPEEVLLDAENLPAFNVQQFEGRLIQPITRGAIYILAVSCLAMLVILGGRVAYLQLIKGGIFLERSRDNNLRLIPIFAKRGLILDRRGRELAWNDPERVYSPQTGLAHLLGYIAYPTEKEIDQNNLNQKEYLGRAGAEESFNYLLHGQKGIRVEEINVSGQVISNAVRQPPIAGQDLRLAVDWRLQHQLYQTIKELAEDRGFGGGAAIIMDVRTGELLALTSYPEYDPNILFAGADQQQIARWVTGEQKPFLNRAIGGLYAPGSIVKPIVALGALAEGVISPEKKIISTGSISIPNPYDPTKSSVFKDWKAHGPVDMRMALAVSSDVYFYEIGGGYKDQPGLGIARLEKYFRLFGLATTTGINLGGETGGTIPSPAWKEKTFAGEPWRIGDTYHTAIGQYGMQVTPLQMVRAFAAIANGGQILQPQLLASSTPIIQSKLNLPAQDFNIIHDGMRLSVHGGGTAQALDVGSVAVAAKTGTAELGITKIRVNSWVAGFWPYLEPHYAFVVVMESGPRENLTGSPYIMRQFFDWLAVSAPEYLN